MKSYVCEGTIVKSTRGREGLVIGVDRTHQIVVIQSARTFFTEKLENLQVVSYKEVQ